MSFFFKSKNKSTGLPPAGRNITSSDGTTPPNNVPVSNGAYTAAKDAAEKSRIGPPPAMAAVTPPYARSGTASPAGDLNVQRDRAGSDTTTQVARNPNIPPPQRPGDLSLYPWSSRKLEFVSAQANPFPRYGAAINAVTSRDGDVYMMGGLINGSTVKGDLWIVEAASGSLNCYPVPTTAEGPGPRVGHASLLVGNAFIVFGGDTKVDEFDTLDDTLYLLNTSTKHWSRALPAGPRPAGRYGHTLNILGSKIFIFGGQVEGYFFNDLVAFDLNALQQPSNRWETLIKNTNDGGPPQGQIPPARTNHSVITWNDKLYLFGGTDGVTWFNDVWVYEPKTNSWSPQECIGFIPTAREGHAAALVGDVMYVFGGRTEEGKDLGDLAAFRIPIRRWYTFQNMGPSPSPRSGHGLSAFGQQILVVGGEPSSAPRDPAELSMAYVLDTAKIRYPPERPSQPGQAARRPSVTDRSGTPQDRSASREGMTRGVNLSNKNSQESINGSQSSFQSAQDNRIGGALPMANPSARPAGQAPIPGQPGPPPQQQAPQPRSNGGRFAFPVPEAGRESPRPVSSKLDRVLGPEFTSRENMRQDARDSPLQDATGASQITPQVEQYGAANLARQDISTISQYDGSNNAQPLARPPSNAVTRDAPKVQEYQALIENTTLASVPSTENRKPDTEREMSMPGQFPVDSGLGSSPSLGRQNDELSKEVESLKSTNAWYASELALAKKAGYRAATENPSAGDRNSEHFGDSEKPLVEAFLKMRSELAAMQNNLDSQTRLAAEKVAQLERQRDAAIAEAVYSKTRLAGRVRRSDGDSSREIGTPDSERSEDASRRLANALSAQSDLTAKVRALQNDIESEKKARLLAEESAETAHERASELDKHKQESTSELESLRAELHEAQKQARDEAAKCSEAVAAHRLMEVDKNDLAGKLSIIQSDTQSHTNILASLQTAVTSSANKAAMLERKLEQERVERNAIEEKMTQLRSEHETSVQDLESTQRRLQDAEELSMSHAEEARTHREAILAGFGQSRDRGVEDVGGRDERLNVIQQQLENAKQLASQHRDAADQSSDKLRRAEERIAGLEAYQEQTSRESLNIRKQLQAASRDALALQSEHAELQQQLANEKLESASVSVQHRALKELLEERGIDTSDLPQPRRSTSSSTSTSERLRELQQQLESSAKAQEDMRTSFEQREVEANKGWEEKLANLDNDYQSAVKYLKGTEKMLSKMKQELHKYKTTNKELEEELARERSTDRSVDNPGLNADWENERTSLQQQLDEMHARVSSSSTQLDQQMADLRAAQVERDSLQQQLNAASEQSRADLNSLRTQNSALEARATEAERKVQILLETVGNSVDNYKRQSQQILQSNGGATGHSRGPSLNSIGDESVYDDDDDDDTVSKADTRNSVALDSLANELETLRSHWETTNKNYRMSDRSDLDRSGVTSDTGARHENLADWRKKLDLEESERGTL